ncbi:MAG: L,D-transpeptidase family protein [Sedimentisphaerales bacterium]
MAQFPAGSYGNQSSKIRILMYIGATAVVIVIIAVAVFLRGRSQEIQTQKPVAVNPIGQPQPPQAGATEANTPAKPVSPAVTNTGPAPVTPAAGSPGAAAMGEPNQQLLVEQAMSLLNQPGGQKIIEARDRLNELLPMLQGQERAFVKEQLSQLSERWLFSKQVLPDDKLCTMYKVSPGDALEKIGRHYNVPFEALMMINGIDKAESLQAGATIKVVNGPFHARISRSTFTMDIYLQNTYVKSFPVGLGKQGMETPMGRWRVAAGGKLIKPRWTDPDTGRTYEPDDPDYPLGSRWIGLEGLEGAAVGKKGFAIHGTKDPQQIGTQGSRGCIRLHNGDAVTVYNLLAAGASLVDVID